MPLFHERNCSTRQVKDSVNMDVERVVPDRGIDLKQAAGGGATGTVNQCVHNRRVSLLWSLRTPLRPQVCSRRQDAGSSDGLAPQCSLDSIGFFIAHTAIDCNVSPGAS